MSELDSGSSDRRVIQFRPLNWGRLIGFAVIAFMAIYLISRLRSILMLFYLSLLIGLAINSLILWLERRRVSRTLAVSGLALIFVTFLVTMGYWVFPPTIAQAQELFDNYPRYYDQAQRWINGILNRYPELQQRFITESTTLEQITPQAGSILRRFGNFALGIGGLLFSAFLVFFLVVYGLINPQPMARAVFELTPADMHDKLERTLKRIQEKVVAWVGGSFILMAIVGIMVYVGLLIIGVPQALLFGIIAAIGEGIPNLGPILSAIPPIAVMLLTDPVKAMWVLVLFVIVQQLENNFIVPTVMGNRLNVHPWALIFMILVMGEMFGLVGIFLATPTTAILGVIYEELVPKPGLQDSVPSTYRVGRVIGGVEGNYNDSC